MRTMLGKGIFFRPTHPRALAVTAAIVLLLFRLNSPLRWLLVIVLGLVYAWDVRKFRPKPSRKLYWLAVVPLNLVAELYEIGVMIRGVDPLSHVGVVTGAVPPPRVTTRAGRRSW